jgi:hypothetical protein
MMTLHLPSRERWTVRYDLVLFSSKFAAVFEKCSHRRYPSPTPVIGERSKWLQSGAWAAAVTVPFVDRSARLHLQEVKQDELVVG